MKMSYKYRAYITQTVENRVRRCLWQCKQLYNIALSQRIMAYKYEQKTISNFDQYDIIRRSGGLDGIGWIGLDSVNIRVLQNILKRLHLAYQSFFRRVKQGTEKAGFPKFQYRNESFTLDLCNGNPYGWSLNGNILVVKNIGAFRLRLHRPIVGRIKTVTIKQECDQWYVIFSCDDVPQFLYPKTDKTIGIYIPRTYFLIDSENNIQNELSYYRKSLAGLIDRQRIVSRRVKGSNRYKLAKLHLAKYHARIARQRKYRIDNIISYYVRNYDVIKVNKFAVAKELEGTGKKGFSREKNKKTLDNAWSLFWTRLENKALASGKQVIFIENFKPDKKASLFENTKNLMACVEPTLKPVKA